MESIVGVEHKAFHARDDRRHILIGFDARQNWLPMANWWPQNGPFLYLLRDDVARPYSVDKNIWSSVCHVLADLARPDDAGPLPPLWNDADRLRTHLATKEGLDRRPHSFVAVTVGVDSIGPGAAEWLSLIGPGGPDLGALDAGWTLAGYDVANPKLLSGLTDAPYDTEQEDLAALKARWVPHLNDHHLFTRFDEAAAFVSVSESRAKRFAPFGVFGIWTRG